MLIDYPTIIAIVGIGGSIFGVYSYFRNPQIKIEQLQALDKQTLKNIELRLATFEAAFTSHLTSDQSSFAQLNQHVVEVDKSVVRLTTIIDERIPKQIT